VENLLLIGIIGVWFFIFVFVVCACKALDNQASIRNAVNITKKEIEEINKRLIINDNGVIKSCYGSYYQGCGFKNPDNYTNDFESYKQKRDGVLSSMLSKELAVAIDRIDSINKNQEEELEKIKCCSKYRKDKRK